MSFPYERMKTKYGRCCIGLEINIKILISEAIQVLILEISLFELKVQCVPFSNI